MSDVVKRVGASLARCRRLTIRIPAPFKKSKTYEHNGYKNLITLTLSYIITAIKFQNFTS